MKNDETNKPHLGWFGPSTGELHYYGSLVIPQLLQNFRVSAFESDSFSERYHGAVFKNTNDPFDIVVYNLNGDPRLYPSRIHLGLLPGVIVFHELFLTTDGPEPIHASPWMATARRFNKGADWPAPGVINPGRTPRALREMAYAIKPVLLRGEQLREFEKGVAARLVSDSEPEIVPFPIERTDVKAPQYGKIAYCGSPRIEHRAHKVLQALSMTNVPFQLHWLIDRSEEKSAHALVREFGVQNVVFSFDRSPQRWSDLVGDAVCALHPCFSAFASPTPYREISLAAAVPILRSEHDNLDLPDSIGVMVAAGDHEAVGMAAALSGMLNSPFRDEAAREWTQKHYSLPVIGAQWRDLLCRFLPRSREFLSRWQEFQKEANRQLVQTAVTLATHTTQNSPSQVEELINTAWRHRVQAAIGEMPIFVTPG